MNMASATRPIWTMSEFDAHNGKVTCLSVGRRTGSVLVTGGEDRAVKLWSFCRDYCIMSVSVNTIVQCVRFAPTENHICAGSIEGILKTYDLVAAKLIRSYMTGHNGAIQTAEFHTDGDLLATGSTDSAIKLWDIRKKGCLFTYVGHTSGINSIRFSPDGQWIASASSDHTVKLWDLRMVKKIQDFALHTDSVISIEFHPQEFLLATASLDKSINFWDLEHFKLIYTSQNHAAVPRCLVFSDFGDCLHIGSKDLLRTDIWEPGRSLSQVSIPWGNIKDLATFTSRSNNNKILGVSYKDSRISAYFINSKQLNELYVNTIDQSTDPAEFLRGTSTRKSFSKTRPTESKKPIAMKSTIEESERSETETEEESTLHIPNVNDFRSIFQPSKSLTRSPPRTPEFDPDYTVDPFAKECQMYSLLSPPPIPPLRTSKPASIVPNSEGLLNVRVPSRANSISDDSYSSSDFPVHIQHSTSENSLPKALLKTYRSKQTNNVQSSHLKVKRALRQTKSDRDVDSRNILSARQNISRNEMRSITSSNNSLNVEENSVLNTSLNEFIPINVDRPTGIDFDDFLPSHRDSHSQIPNLSESEVISSIVGGHDPIIKIFESRIQKLKIIHSIMRGKNIKTAVEMAVSLEDMSVMIDILGLLIQKPSIWNLDIVSVVLPSILDLLQSKYEIHMNIGCDTLRFILKNFASVIKTNVSTGNPGSVDIAREERYNKCMCCYETLVAIRTFLLKRQTLQGSLGQNFRELHNSIQAIDLN